MTNPDVVSMAKDLAPVAKGAQILQLIKDNQLITAVILFLLWTSGSIATAAEYAGWA